MPADGRPPHLGDGADRSDPVLAELGAFGATLTADSERAAERVAARSSVPLRPTPSHPSLTDNGRRPDGGDAGGVRRWQPRALVLVAAAVAVALVGLAVVRFAPNGQTVESVDEPPPGTEQPTPLPETPSEADADGSPDADDSTDLVDAATWPGPDAGEAVILAADGSVLARYEPLALPSPTTTTQPSSSESDEGPPRPAAFVDPTLDPRHAGSAEVYVAAVVSKLAEIDADGRWGGALTAGGVRIQTSYRPDLAEGAGAAIAGSAPLIAADREVALVSVDVETGEILALAGSDTGTDEGLTLSLDGARPSGGAFGPILLAAALEEGWTAADEVRSDAPCEFEVDPNSGLDTWVVRGGDDEPTTRPLSEVINPQYECAAARMAFAIGPDAVGGVAEALGAVKPPGYGYTPTIAIGAVDSSPVGLAQAMAALANDGERHAPWLIERIDSADGTPLYVRQPAPTAVVSPQTARSVIASMVRQAAELSSTRVALDEGQAVAGQIGVAPSTDSWYVGTTAQVATVVWVGDAEGVFGGFPDEDQVAATALIWTVYNNVAHADLDPEPFQAPEPATGGRVLATDAEITTG
ncbi:MAG: penicillin-binding transpeptidase domain-containing protein [Actinomycetota bacterium]